MPKYNKTLYKQYIANHQIEQLIEKLLQELHQYIAVHPQSKLQNTYDALIMLSGKCKSIQQEENLNIADVQATKIEKSRINKTLIDLINNLPKDYFDFLNGDKKPSPSTKPDLRQQIEKVHQSSSYEYDVFFSFSSQDLSEAKRICEELRGYGLHVFLSDEALKANTGLPFFEKIDYALKNSQHFILLSSVDAMASEWVKTEYQTFFNEYYIKQKRERRFIILKSKNYSAAAVPGLLKTLQFANSPKEILATFIKDKRFKDRQEEKKRQAAARTLEQQALAEKRQKEQKALEQKALAEQRQREENRLLQQQVTERQAKQKELQERALQEKRARERQQAQAAQAKQAAAEKRRKKAERQAAWTAFFDKNGKKIGLGLLVLIGLIIGKQIIPSMIFMSQEEVDIIQTIEKNMMQIPSGTFTMGCTSEQSDCDDDEKPTNEVSISSFKMNKYEVTQKEWRAVMDSDPTKLMFKGCDKCPVENVTWNDIQDFLKKLNRLTGKNYCLPSEAEWEYAARGNERYKYAGSNDIGMVAWYYKNSDRKTHPVGGKKANGFGLYDMSGNVWEWCNGDKRKHTSSSQTNPEGNSFIRVYRGGSWGGNAQYCRVANRDDFSPNYRRNRIGFRLAHR